MNADFRRFRLSTGSSKATGHPMASPCCCFMAQVETNPILFRLATRWPLGRLYSALGAESWRRNAPIFSPFG